MRTLLEVFEALILLALFAFVIKQLFFPASPAKKDEDKKI